MAEQNRIEDRTEDRIEIQLKLQRDEFALDAHLSLPAQGISVLFGVSGSGKTTLLRCVAGLEPAAQGSVQVGEDVWQASASNYFLPVHHRPLGYVFQEASLFEHLNVRQNIEFGLRRTHSPHASDSMQAALELLGIAHLLKRRVNELSGGERQRVAIARALATSPKLLLLDEPLAALDPARKLEVLPWLERLRDELRIPMIYVTHSVQELSRLGDHVVVLENGQVKASGSVSDLLSSLDVRIVDGDELGVVLDGQVVQLDQNFHLAQVAFDGESFWLRDSGLKQGQAVRFRILAKDVSLATQEPQHTSIQNHLAAQIVSAIEDTHPSQMLVRLRFGNSHLIARITQRAWRHLALEINQTVWAQVKSVALVS